MCANNWSEYQSATLRGFFTHRLPSGLTMHGCMLHQNAGGRCVGLPRRAQVEAGELKRDAEGEIAYTPVIEVAQHAREIAYTPVIEVAQQARERFKRQTFAAVDRLLNGAAAT